MSARAAAHDAGASLVIRDAQHYLVVCAEVLALTERIERVEDAKQLADKAAAARVWAQRARLGETQVNLAAIAKLWAERRAGELLTLARENGQRENGFGVVHRDSKTTLADLGITRDESSQWQKLAQVPADEFQAAIDTASEEGTVSRARVMAVHYSAASVTRYGCFGGRPRRRPTGAVGLRAHRSIFARSQTRPVGSVAYGAGQSSRFTSRWAVRWLTPSRAAICETVSSSGTGSEARWRLGCLWRCPAIYRIMADLLPIERKEPA